MNDKPLSRETTNTKKVVVIGAGFAGLSAAYHLQQENKQRNEHWKIEILEARDRVGGRVHSWQPDNDDNI
jgi:oxygen-dependent protoporphyrinogen oxidase